MLSSSLAANAGRQAHARGEIHQLSPHQNEWAVEVSTQAAAPHSPKNHKIASQKKDVVSLHHQT
jgi:hypothetical protein